MVVVGDAAGREIVETCVSALSGVVGRERVERILGIPPQEPLASRRSAGDAGHVPGCARDHGLDTACAVPQDPGGDPREMAMRLLALDACATLPDLLRRAYALDEGQVATVLRVADALASSVSLEARETLGREARRSWMGEDSIGATGGDDGWAWEIPEASREHWRKAGERLFALGRASVVPPDADLGRVIASWCVLTSWERGNLVSNVERIARRHWSDLAATALSPEGCAPFDRVPLSLTYALGPGVMVDGGEVWESGGPRPLTAEEWQRLRAAGVPVADGVGV